MPQGDRPFSFVVYSSEIRDFGFYVKLSSLSLQHFLFLNTINIGAFENRCGLVELAVPILDDRLNQLVAGFGTGEETVAFLAKLDQALLIVVTAINDKHGILVRQAIGIPQVREILKRRNIVCASREVSVANRRSRICID